jgi:hypothetical protein
MIGQSRILKLTFEEKTLTIMSKPETKCLSQQILFLEILCIIQSMNNLRNTMETNLHRMRKASPPKMTHESHSFYDYIIELMKIQKAQ